MALDREDLAQLAELLFDRLSTRFGALAQQSAADRAASVTGQGPLVKTGNYTIGPIDYLVIFNAGATATVTLPMPSTARGRQLRLVTTAAFTVVSASANVVPLAGGAAGTAILAATPGKWADLESDGANWRITASN